jgi:hypothetical protein
MNVIILASLWFLANTIIKNEGGLNFAQAAFFAFMGLSLSPFILKVTLGIAAIVIDLAGPKRSEKLVCAITDHYDVYFGMIFIQKLNDHFGVKQSYGLPWFIPAKGVIIFNRAFLSQKLLKKSAYIALEKANLKRDI